MQSSTSYVRSSPRILPSRNGVAPSGGPLSDLASLDQHSSSNAMNHTSTLRSHTSTSSRSPTSTRRAPSSPTSPPRSLPLFASRLSPTVSSKPLPSLSPASPSSPLPLSTTPTPRRRTTPLAGTVAAREKEREREKALGRGWNRRLSFGSPPPTATASTSRPSAGTEAGEAGEACAFGGGKEGGKDAFDLSSMSMDVDGIENEVVVPSRNVTPRSARRSMPKPVSRKKRTARTGINDLPDELLLRIFGFLNDQHGFRPLPGSSSSPQWYNPPLRIAVVCKRWLPLARQLFYRFIKISHLSRIPRLYSTFSTTDLPLSVRHLCIELPFSAVEALGVLPASALLATTSNGIGEADSDVGSGRSSPVDVGDGSWRLDTSKKRREKEKKLLLLPSDQLRAIFQSCSELLSLEITGVPPSLLFSSSSSSTTSSLDRSPVSLASPPSSPSALHHLHLLRLSTVTSLSLKALTSFPGSPSSDLTSTTLRDALLALTSLRRLTLRGYVSAPLTSPLDFSPSSTPAGYLSRRLPTRARLQTLLPLSHLKLIDCALSPSDLLTLLRQIRKGSLRSLSVEEGFMPREARERERRGEWARPTVEGLNAEGVKELLEDGLESLRVTLHNYPQVDAGGPAILTSPSTSPSSSSSFSSSYPSTSPTSPRLTRRAFTREKQHSQEPHLLDTFISSLENLTALDLGGSVVSPALFLPPPPLLSHPHAVHFPSSSPYGSANPPPPPPPSLPRTLKTLTLRSCPSITPLSLSSLLLPPVCHSSPSSAAAAAAPPLPALHTLRVFASSEYGWAHPSSSWEFQRGCWRAGVALITGPRAGTSEGDGREAEGEGRRAREEGRW